MAIQPTFFWHDYETSGADARRDRPMQFAGIRTDDQLNIIEEPVMFYCRPADDLLPHPQACLITGILPQTALTDGYCEAEFIKKVHEELARPGTCGVGYNSIRFDDEITRNALYRNFFDPYGREWQNDCSRWDVIDMMRLTRALRPEGIVWPEYDDGSPSMRLEDLTKANGIDHGNAHDALSDVYATIAIAKLVKEKQPKLYDYVVNNRSKQSILSKLDIVSHKPVLHVSSRYSAELGNSAIVAPLAGHPVNKNAVLVWDLRIDPTPLFELPVEEIRRLMYLPKDQRQPTDAEISLKQVHANKCPIIAPAGMLTAVEAERLHIDGDTCRQHLSMLRNFSGLTAKVMDIFNDNPFEADSDPDLMLYSGGFFCSSDKKAMDQIRAADVEQLCELDLAFQDPRLEEMLIRYKARNYPQTLTDEERVQWEEHRTRRLLGPDSGGHLTIPELFKLMNELYQKPELTSRDRHILEELAIYAESIYPMDESW